MQSPRNKAQDLAAPAAPTLLQSFVGALRGDHVATSEFLGTYASILSYRLAHEVWTEQNSTAGSRFKETAKTLWFQLGELTRNQLRPRFTPQSFQVVWDESLQFLQSYRGPDLVDEDDDWFMQMVEEDDFGCQCLKLVALLFERLQEIPAISKWIKAFLVAQPRYVDRSSDLDAQIFGRKMANFDVLPDLARLIGIFCKDTGTLANLVLQFGSLVRTATNYCLSTSNELTADRVNQDLEAVIRAFRLAVSQPLSVGGLNERHQLASINYRGTFELVVGDFLKLTTDSNTPLSEIRWRMFQKFVNGILHTAVRYGSEYAGNVRHALAMCKLDEFLDPDALPVPGWDCVRFHDLLEVEDDADDEEVDDDLYNLPDVYFEPAGPERQVQHYAVAVARASDLSEDNCPICIDVLNVHETNREEVPVQIECGHCFHYGCLHTLINGISKFSNLCPNCRHVVCEPRERRLKDIYQSSFPHLSDTGLNGTADVEIADLQDTDGDVVMTDG